MPGRRRIAKKYIGSRYVKRVRRDGQGAHRFLRPIFGGIKRFKRACPFSNSANLGVGGTISKHANALVMTIATSGGVSPIQFGACALKFSLSDVVNSTEFTLLFDSYRIVKVGVKIVPFFTQSSTGAAVSATSAQTSVLIHSIIDYDDSTTPTATDAGVSEMRQFSSYKMKNISTGKGSFYRTFRPLTAVPVFASGVFSSYATGNKNMWLDCNSPDTEHYGLKIIMEANDSGANTVLYFKCEYTIYMEFKDVR